MSAIASGPAFFQSWVIRLENFTILQKITEGHGLMATLVNEYDKHGLPIVPEEGDPISVFITGDREVQPWECKDMIDRYYFSSCAKREGGKSSAKEK